MRVSRLKRSNQIFRTDALTVPDRTSYTFTWVAQKRCISDELAIDRRHPLSDVRVPTGKRCMAGVRVVKQLEVFQISYAPVVVHHRYWPGNRSDRRVPTRLGRPTVRQLLPTDYRPTTPVPRAAAYRSRPGAAVIAECVGSLALYRSAPPTLLGSCANQLGLLHRTTGRTEKAWQHMFAPARARSDRAL